MQVSNQFPKDFPRFLQISKDFKDYAGDLLNFLGSPLLRTNTPKKLSDFLRLEMDVRDLQISDSQLYFKLLKIVGLLHQFPTLENRKCNVNHIRLY